MNLFTLQRRSFAHFRRTNLAVVLGVTVGAATLTGALIVGDSMRASLRDAAVGRLGSVEHALISHRFVRAQLVEQIARDLDPMDAVGAVLLRGGASRGTTRVERINLIGVGADFWTLDPRVAEVQWSDQRGVVLNRRLADELGAGVGDFVVLRAGRPAPVSTETLLGRRDEAALAVTLPVHAIIPAKGLGAFSLNPQQALPRNAYMPLPVLQGVLDREQRVNAVLVAGQSETDAERLGGVLAAALQDHLTLEDVGVALRRDETHGYVAIESEAFLLEPAIEAAVDASGLRGERVLAYLANEIALKADTDTQPARTIPYSAVAAIDATTIAAAGFELREAAGRTGETPMLPSEPPAALQPGEILLNEWAADDLGARVGDRIRLRYYITGRLGELQTAHESFTLRGVVKLSGGAADPGFTPRYEGLTTAATVADWDPPFPVDLSRVRDRDEEYWERYNATPKAFVTLADGQRLWAHDADRLGKLTSIRVRPAEGEDLAACERRIRDALRSRLDPAALGLRFEPVRARAAEAAAGSTDFGMLFIGFSFFLIVSAGMLVALLFRLGVERRSREIGILLATGFSPRLVTLLLLMEGAVLAEIGTILGLFGAVGYGWLMLAGLRTWWSAAVNAPFLQLHVSFTTIIIGWCASGFVAFVSLAWSIRGVTRMAPRALLAGATPGDDRGARRKRRPVALVVAGICAAAAIAIGLIAGMSDALPQAPAFFGSGAAMLVACLAFTRHLLGGPRGGAIHRPGGVALLRLGWRNARRQPLRSMLTVALVASATFIIAALDAFRLEAESQTRDRGSGTGGYALLAESAVPLPYDLATLDGRRSLGFPEPDAAELAATEFIPLRLRPGDESSCLNLYLPSEPRIAGATPEMIRRGGFRFSAALAGPEATVTAPANPWKLLDVESPDGWIPVIGDEAAVKWQLHLDLGKDLTVIDEAGREVALRFVALLSGSALQDELIVSERNFRRLFPSIDGYGFFLIDSPPGDTQVVSRTLEGELERYGFDVRRTADRLNEYLAVQNTYLSTFRSLGGLGLVLGTIGLATVLLRNVWERRGELALMRALGFSRAALGVIVLAENAALVVAGLLMGVVPAMVAVAPHLVQRAGSVPWPSLGLTLLGVLAGGVGVGAVALRPVLRAPLLHALRAE